jgi:hypothetical protein
MYMSNHFQIFLLSLWLPIPGIPKNTSNFIQKMNISAMKCKEYIIAN